MSKSNEFENALLDLIFNNTDIGNIGDVTGIQGSTTPGNLYVSLHTSDPGESVTDPTTTETTYTGYDRVAVARSTTGWTVTGNSVSPAADIDFGECTASPGSAIGWFAITTGTDGSGDEMVLYYGALSPSITMSTGVIPRIKSTSTITED